MKNLFSWRIKPSEAEFSDLWKNATFVFDTNFLLDLYRVSRFTAEDYLNNILEHIQNRVWLPHQVASEFFDRREGVIQKEAESFQKAISELEKWKAEQQSFSRLRGCLSQAGRIVSSEVECLFNDQKTYFDSIEQVEKSFREKIEQLEKDHASLNPDEDFILEKLLLLFDTKVGEPFPEEDLTNLKKEADERYQRLQAPGFKDKNKKDEREYGDFLLWKQILNFAKKESRPIIFVTGEKKDDWWIKRNGKPVSPREDLRCEFLEVTQQPFWIYQTQDFLDLVVQRLKIKIEQRSIDETIAIADLETDDESLRQDLEQIQISDSTTQSLEQNKMSKAFSQMVAGSNLVAKAMAEQYNLAGVSQILAASNQILAEQYNLAGVSQILAASNQILADRSNGINALAQTADDLSQVHEQAKIAESDDS
ncbi:PIN-like domain-containing protein [Pseudanabaena sp. BC1403]|uniref:PIN-like domain-containing protein n=1 Tax=Pseudanabaena sp. BC1403 TaxID=2043171 RepID=UPI000CD84CF5|nr:PIN domain-containing protein [Pseudanabaena sp. BC1403]